MKIVLIGSGKGGVGKSTISVSIALLLKMLGYKVGLIDADIYGPSLRGMLEPARFPREENGLLVPALAKGIEVISAAYFSKFDQGAPVRAPLVNGIIDQFISGVKWNERDVIIVDLPPGTGDIQLTILQKIKASGFVAVTTPQKIATIDVEKAMHQMRRMDVPIWGVIENMSYYQDSLTGEKHAVFGKGGGMALAKKFDTTLLGEVPIDPFLMESLDQGEGAKFSFSSEVLLKIAIEISHLVCDDESGKKIVEVKKIDAHHVLIEGQEKQVQYRFSDLQQRCPCARCFENERPSDPNVSVTSIEKVGAYAVRFRFTSGCSQGMYTWQNFLS